MENTILIEITNKKALGIIRELEELHLIKVLKPETTGQPKLSDKYKGVISKEQGKDLNRHIEQMRNEWNNT